MTIDERLEKLTERHEALTLNLELLTRDVQDLKVAAQQDGENIRALARIAEIHDRRLTHLEDSERP
jgi:prefoldin subunit 5